MSKLDLTIITPTFYPSNRQYEYLLKSIRRHHINEDVMVINYGMNELYTGWIQTHIDRCLDVLYALRTKYVLFTDASDVMFLKGAREIMDRYMRLGHPPMLVSTEDPGMNAGGWIGETQVAIAILKHLQTLGDIPAAGDPQERWRFALRSLKILVMFDSHDLIFSVNRFPTDACILHCAGGYSDPETGRAARLKTVWERLEWS